MEDEDFEHLIEIQKCLKSAIDNLDEIILISDRVQDRDCYREFFRDMYLCISLDEALEVVLERINEAIVEQEEKWDE